MGGRGRRGHTRPCSDQARQKTEDRRAQRVHARWSSQRVKTGHGGRLGQESVSPGGGVEWGGVRHRPDLYVLAILSPGTCRQFTLVGPGLAVCYMGFRKEKESAVSCNKSEICHVRRSRMPWVFRGLTAGSHHSSWWGGGDKDRPNFG